MGWVLVLTMIMLLVLVIVMMTMMGRAVWWLENYENRVVYMVVCIVVWHTKNYGNGNSIYLHAGSL